MPHDKIDKLDFHNFRFQKYLIFEKKYALGIAYLYRMIYNIWLKFQLFYFKHACLPVDSSVAALSMMLAVLNFAIKKNQRRYIIKICHARINHKSDKWSAPWPIDKFVFLVEYPGMDTNHLGLESMGLMDFGELGPNKTELLMAKTPSYRVACI